VTVMICALVCVLAAALVMIALRGAPGAGESPGPDGTVGEP